MALATMTTASGLQRLRLSPEPLWTIMLQQALMQLTQDQGSKHVKPVFWRKMRQWWQMIWKPLYEILAKALPA